MISAQNERRSLLNGSAWTFTLPNQAESASLVEVRFTALGNERTRVELAQSNWEAFGERAETMRGGYGGGWVVIFEQAFKSACGG